MKTPYLKQFPDDKGYFGKFGGAFVPDEILLCLDVYKVIADSLLVQVYLFGTDTDICIGYITGYCLYKLIYLTGLALLP